MTAAIHRRMATRRDEEREGGFTLIELMVVVMIIAILVGIAIPAFLGARKRAQDTAAKSNLRNALGTAQTIFTDTQAYPITGDAATAGTMIYSLTADEPSLTFQTADSTTSKQISVLTHATVPGDTIVMAAKSASGKCFFLRHVATAGAAGAGSNIQSVTAAAGACEAADAPAVADTNWKPL